VRRLHAAYREWGYRWMCASKPELDELTALSAGVKRAGLVPPTEPAANRKREREKGDR
jgi:hypothetical protein